MYIVFNKGDQVFAYRIRIFIVSALKFRTKYLLTFSIRFGLKVFSQRLT